MAEEPPTGIEDLGDEDLRRIIREGTTYALTITGGDVEIATSVAIRTDVARRAHEVLMRRVEKVAAQTREANDYPYTGVY